MLSWILGAALAAVLFYYFIVKPYDYWKERGVAQGKPLWFFGDNWETIIKRKSIADMVVCLYNQCPGVRYSGAYQFLTPSLILKDPELIKDVTIKDFDHFTDHIAFIPDDADPLWGRNLFALKGQKWRGMRAILSPSFTSSKMKTMFVLITESAENFVQHFLKKDEDILTLDFKDVFTRFTTDVIATTAFGLKVDSLDQPKNEFYLMGKQVTFFDGGFWQNMKFIGYILVPKILKLFQIKLFTTKVSNFFLDLVHGTIKTRKEKGIVRPDMINLLMQVRETVHKQDESGMVDTGFATALESDSVLGEEKIPRELTNMDITAQALIFFLAGFESVSALLCFTAYELAANPDIQDRLREEIRATLKECEGTLTYESLLKMKYMDMVVSESLRKWPNSIILDRICTKPYIIQPTAPEEKPVYLEKGMMIWLPTFAIHRDSEYYPDPERFDPERFNDENKGNIKPYTYFPFGLGPRNCIGSRFALLEVKTVFFYILQHFELVPVERSQIPLKICKKALNLTAEGGFWYGLKRIKK